MRYDSAMHVLADIAERLAPSGLILRGGFHPTPADGVPGQAATVVLVGNAGRPDGDPMWRAFAAARNETARDPLNDWTRATIGAIAQACGAIAHYPFDGPPYLPFQRWARRAEPVSPSPLGIFIHPEFGLWHAYRAALMFAERLNLPERRDAASPCASCATQPCLSACPVGAFSATGLDAQSCATHLDAAAGGECVERGCLARRACPIGADRAQEPAQAEFHLRAFRRGVVL